MKSVIALGLLACSGLVNAAPVTVSFEGYSSAIKNDNVKVISTGEKQFFTVSIDFEKCIMTNGEEVTEGTHCDKGTFVSMSSEMIGVIPYVSQTWIYERPNGAFIYTWQVAHGWQTSVFRGDSYKVVR